jgi:hypothetical protein
MARIGLGASGLTWLFYPKAPVRERPSVSCIMMDRDPLRLNEYLTDRAEMLSPSSHCGALLWTL